MTYDINDYTDDGHLKPGIFMTIIVLYSSRFLLYGPLSLLASRSGSIGSPVSLDVSFLTADSPLHMLSSIPAVFFIYLMLSRRPQSSNFARMSWKNARWWLGGATVFQFGLELYGLFTLKQVGVVPLVLAVASLYVVYYLCFSQRVKDVLSSFPEPFGTTRSSDE